MSNPKTGKKDFENNWGKNSKKITNFNTNKTADGWKIMTPKATINAAGVVVEGQKKGYYIVRYKNKLTTKIYKIPTTSYAVWLENNSNNLIYFKIDGKKISKLGFVLPKGKDVPTKEQVDEVKTSAESAASMKAYYKRIYNI